MMQLDPLSLLSIAVIQIGSRHLSLNLTEYQKRMLQHPLTQMIILFSLVYVSTKDLKTSLIVVTLIYVSIHIIFNDENEFSIVMRDMEDIRKNYESHLESD